MSVAFVENNICLCYCIGNGWLIIEFNAFHASNSIFSRVEDPSVRVYIDSLGKEPVYFSGSLGLLNRWSHMNGIYQSPKIKNTSHVTIEIMDGSNIYHVKNQPIPTFVEHFNLESPNKMVKIYYYPIWVDEFSNDNYYGTLTSEGTNVKSPIKSFESCHINSTELNEYLLVNNP